MKKRIFIYQCVAMFFALFSCNSDLNIDPTTSLDNGLALKTSKDVEALLVGTYNNLGSTDLYSGGVYVYADLLASDTTGEDINFYGTFQDLTQISNKQTTINNDFVRTTWLSAYATINNANEVLNALSLVDAASKARVEGEAKFIRGSMYFELIKLYAKAWNDGNPNTNPGVPIVLLPTHTFDDANKHPARNTVKEVYDQILKDLHDAESLLTAPGSSSYYYATTGAASAQLSRVYLTQANYDSALSKADKVISSGLYKLTDKYTSEFPYIGTPARIYNTSEDVFALQVSEQQGTNSLNTYYAQTNYGGRGDIEINNDFLSFYSAGDTRGAFYTDDSTGYSYTDKFDNLYGNVKILRLAEMYLTRAECNIQLTSTVGDDPLNDINAVRIRAGAAPLGVVTLQDVLDERHLELIFEGQWLVDAKRTGTDISGLPWNSPRLILPIPQRETIENPNMVQNEGY